MGKALVLGAAALALSAGVASAQAPGYNYYGATVPLYGYAAPVIVAPPIYAAPPVYAAPRVYAVPAPLYGYGYAAPWDYAPGGREWVVERGW